jgi:hypothetical protein
MNNVKNSESQLIRESNHSTVNINVETQLKTISNFQPLPQAPHLRFSALYTSFLSNLTAPHHDSPPFTVAVEPSLRVQSNNTSTSQTPSPLPSPLLSSLPSSLPSPLPSLQPPTTHSLIPRVPGSRGRRVRRKVEVNSNTQIHNS